MVLHNKPPPDSQPYHRHPNFPHFKCSEIFFQLISGKVFRLISRNLLWLGLESPHHFWPTFGFLSIRDKEICRQLSNFLDALLYLFLSRHSQARETLSFLKANNSIPYLISEKLEILLFIQLSTQWHQMPSKTLERRRATPSMHRLGWI